MFNCYGPLVVVSVAVLSESGSTDDLIAADFRIREDGAERPISVFAPPRFEPGEYVVAVDTSGSSLAWPIPEATNLLLDTLHPGSCVLLMPFAERLLESVWGHPGDADLRARVAGLDFQGQEGIFDALLAALAWLRDRAAQAERSTAVEAHFASGPGRAELMRFRQPPEGLRGDETPVVDGECAQATDSRDPPPGGLPPDRAIIVVTDGDDHASRSTVEDVVTAGWGAGLPVFVLAAEPRASSGGLGSMGRPSHYGSMSALERLTEFTGGFVFRGVRRSPEHRDVWVQLQRMIGSLRGRFVLGYVPPEPEGEDPFVSRHQIDVQILRPGYKVVAQSHVVRGRGATSASALDLARRGFDALVASRVDEATRAFTGALAIDAGSAWAHYGQGIAAILHGSSDDALASLQAAAAAAPWLPDLDARLADLYSDAGTYELAWEHVLKAHQAGSNVSATLEQLLLAAPRQIDLTPTPNVARVLLQASGAGDIRARTAAPLILGAVGRAVWSSPTMAVASEASDSDLVLRVQVDSVRRRGTSYSVSGWLVLTDSRGHELEQVRMNLTDVSASEQVDATLAAAFPELERAVAEFLHR